MTNIVQYVSSAGDTSRGPSPIIWGTCPVGAILTQEADGRGGTHFFDDFENFSNHISDQQTQQYSSYVDTGVTFKQQRGDGGTGFDAADALGAVECAGNDANNDEGVLATHGPLANISNAAGQKSKVWFEARVKRANITDNYSMMFIGLAYDHGSSVPITNTLALTDDDGDLGAFSYLGFHVDAADGDAIDAVYKAEGQAQTVNLAAADVPVADTYAKLGFFYNPHADDAKQITWFVDGVEQSTYVTTTQIDAATFPESEPLGLAWVVKTGETDAALAQLDWWRVATVPVT
jgi:hypothetical protein